MQKEGPHLFGGDIGQIGMLSIVISDVIPAFRHPLELLLEIGSLRLIRFGECVEDQQPKVPTPAEIRMGVEELLKKADRGIRVWNKLTVLVLHK